GPEAPGARRIETAVELAGQSFGVLRVWRASDDTPFEPEHATRLATLVPRAALVIESARAYAREAAARARLQALLDSVPSGIVFLEREGSVPVLNRFLEPFVHLGLDREDHPLRRAQRTREGVEERASLER